MPRLLLFLQEFGDGRRRRAGRARRRGVTVRRLPAAPARLGRHRLPSLGLRDRLPDEALRRSVQGAATKVEILEFRASQIVRVLRAFRGQRCRC